MTALNKGQRNALGQKYAFENNITGLMNLISVYPDMEGSLAPTVKKALQKMDNINEQLIACGLDMKVEVK